MMGFKVTAGKGLGKKVVGVSEQWWDLKTDLQHTRVLQQQALANNDGI